MKNCQYLVKIVIIRSLYLLLVGFFIVTPFLAQALSYPLTRDDVQDFLKKYADKPEEISRAIAEAFEKALTEEIAGMNLDGLSEYERKKIIDPIKKKFLDEAKEIIGDDQRANQKDLEDAFNSVADRCVKTKCVLEEKGADVKKDGARGVAVYRIRKLLVKVDDGLATFKTKMGETVGAIEAGRREAEAGANSIWFKWFGLGASKLAAGFRKLDVATFHVLPRMESVVGYLTIIRNSLEELLNDIKNGRIDRVDQLMSKIAFIESEIRGLEEILNQLKRLAVQMGKNDLAAELDTSIAELQKAKADLAKMKENKDLGLLVNNPPQPNPPKPPSSTPSGTPPGPTITPEMLRQQEKEIKKLQEELDKLNNLLGGPKKTSYIIDAYALTAQLNLIEKIKQQQDDQKSENHDATKQYEENQKKLEELRKQIAEMRKEIREKSGITVTVYCYPDNGKPLKEADPQYIAMCNDIKTRVEKETGLKPNVLYGWPKGFTPNAGSGDTFLVEMHDKSGKLIGDRPLGFNMNSANKGKIEKAIQAEEAKKLGQQEQKPNILPPISSQPKPGTKPTQQSTPRLVSPAGTRADPGKQWVRGSDGVWRQVPLPKDSLPSSGPKTDIRYPDNRKAPTQKEQIDYRN